MTDSTISARADSVCADTLISSIKDLQALPIWTCFRLERAMDREGRDVFNGDGTPKMNKMPYNPATNLPAKSSDSRTWATYETAAAAVAAGRYSCTGFAFGGVPDLIGIDLDHHLSADGSPDEYAAGILEMFPGAYTEISPSGRGLHILILGGNTFSGSVGIAPKDTVFDAEAIEIYRAAKRPREAMQERFDADQKSAKPRFRSVEDVGDIDGGRFFTYTGKVYGGRETIADHAAAARALVQKVLSKLADSRKKNGILSNEAAEKKAAVQQDPRTKRGIVGEFCRTYDVPAAIAKFLPSVYEDEGGGRYTYTAGTSTKGLVLYEGGLFAYSNHATDPAYKMLCNSFDLVRIHMFGELDIANPAAEGRRAESYKAMRDLANDDPAVKETVAREKAEAAKGDFNDDPNWKNALEYDENGRKLLANARNVMRILWHDPNLQGIRLNRFSGYREVQGDSLQWERHGKFWDDNDDSQLYMYISGAYGIEPQDKNVRHAFNTVTSRRSFHPLEDYLHGLPKWDGWQRCETLLIDYLGADDTAYTRTVTRKALIAAVRRVWEPGCKFDNILVLVGPQGVGKSALLARLGGEYFSDSLSWPDVHDKTAAEKLQGIWIMESPEMQGMRKTEIESVKRFITCQWDDFRAPYARNVTRHPRQTVIFGTTNSKTGFLRDTTGNRRFWPVETPGCGRNVIRELTDYERDQIWAEAAELEAAGEELFIEDQAVLKQAEAAQRLALEQDARQGLIENYLNTKLPYDWESWTAEQRANYFAPHHDMLTAKRPGVIARTTVSTLEIWCECLQFPAGRFTKRDAYDISAVMACIDGWIKTDRRIRSDAYGRQRVYERVED